MAGVSLHRVCFARSNLVKYRVFRALIFFFDIIYENEHNKLHKNVNYMCMYRFLEENFIWY